MRNRFTNDPELKLLVSNASGAARRAFALWSRDAPPDEDWTPDAPSENGNAGRVRGPYHGEYVSKQFADRAKFARERELLKSEERFRAFVTATSDVVYCMSADWEEMRYLDGKRFIADTTGPNRAWLMQYIRSEDQPRVMAAINEAIRTKSNFELQHQVIRADGTLGWTFSRAVPILDDRGEIVEWFGAARDITAEKQAEESLRNTVQRKDEILALIAHELRNPLAPISNAVQMLKRVGADDPVTIQARSIIERQVAVLNRLVEDLLETTRLAEKRLNLRHERVDLAVVTQLAIETAQPLIDKRKHSLSVALASEPVEVSGDRVRLQQVVVNLLNNAAKYTAEGGRIAVELAVEGGDAILKVRDNGFGIEPELLPRLFDAFTQAHSSLEHSHGGLGLGLYLVCSIVQMHDGDIRVISSVGHGSEFVVRLPLWRA